MFAKPNGTATTCIYRVNRAGAHLATMMRVLVMHLPPGPRVQQVLVVRLVAGTTLPHSPWCAQLLQAGMSLQSALPGLLKAGGPETAVVKRSCPGRPLARSDD